jgi:hypothetical protein
MSHAPFDANPGRESVGSNHQSLRGPAEPGNSNSLGTSGASGTFTPSSVRSNPSVSQVQGPESAGTDERVRVLKELELAVDSCRKGEVSKKGTISSVLRILDENPHVAHTESQKEATFNSYLTEIISIESPQGEHSHVQDVEEVQPVDTEAVDPKGSGTKRSSCRDRDLSDSGSEGDDDKPAKKSKLRESDLPWSTTLAEPTSVFIHPSCQETCRLLRTYNLDIAKAKFCAKVAPSSPPGIPSSQWEKILKGDAVDLNQIFTSLHHTVADEERTGRLGDSEISFGVVEAKKRISTAAEWSVSWRRASKAIVFAFPHRREELLDYGDYIESEFAAKIVSSHHKLLLYDLALRNEVAGGQHALLTDHARFSRLYSAIVLPDGVEAGASKPSGGKPSGSRSSGGKPEICNKFNAGTCKNADADCKYRHACKKCKKPGHGDKDCPPGGQ